MNGHVLAVHPVVSHVRSRGTGRSRLRLGAVSTPVAIDERPGSDFEEVAAFDNGIAGAPPVRVYAHEGALWQETRVAAGELPEILSRPPWGGPYVTGLTGMVGTPLAASLASNEGSPDVRPDAAEVDRAREDLAAFLASGLRVVSGRVMARCRGPVAIHSTTRMAPTYVVALHGGRRTVTPSTGSTHLIAPRADRVAEFWSFERWFHARACDVNISDRDFHSPVEVGWNGLRGVDPGLFGEPELEALCNDGPGLGLRSVPRDADAATLAAADALAPWARIGATGGVRPHEREAVALAVLALAEAMALPNGPLGVPVPLAKLARYAGAVALPRLRADPSPPDEDDANAMSGLGP